MMRGPPDYLDRLKEQADEIERLQTAIKQLGTRLIEANNPDRWPTVVEPNEMARKAVLDDMREWALTAKGSVLPKPLEFVKYINRYAKERSGE